MNQLKYIQKAIEIESITDSTNNIILKTKNSNYSLNYFFMEEDLKYYNTLMDFIRLIESMIKTNEMYSQYCNTLKYEKGLNRCSLYSNLDPSVTQIDIYHGPIFSLRDIIDVCIKKRFDDKKSVSSLEIVDDIIDLHSKGIVQIIILSKMIIDSLNTYKNKNVDMPFLDINLAYGDVITFIRRYKKYFNITHLMKIQEYIKLYKINRSLNQVDSLDFLKSFIDNWNKK